MKTDYLEYHLPENESLTDFDLTLTFDHWQSQGYGSSYRHFHLFLYHYNGSEGYTRLAGAGLKDCWAGGSAGRYHVIAGDKSDDGFDKYEVPLEGSAKLVFHRESGQLTVKIYEVDGSDEELVRAITTEGSGLPLNCLRLRYQTLWHEHSKVWVKDLLLEGRLTSTQYRLQGDTYVDPVAMSFGSGWLGFVKNTPQKPLTVNTYQESRTAAEWISYLINHFLANKLEPSFELTWEMLTSPEERMAWATGEKGAAMMGYPTHLDSLTNNFKAVLPSSTVFNFQPNLAFRPELLFYEDSQTYSLNGQGYLQHWLLNSHIDKGVDYNYQSSFSQNNNQKPMTDSLLFSTDFNSSNWNYNYNWETKDLGAFDYLGENAGLVYDPLLGTFTLRLAEDNLLEDPAFESVNCLNTNESTHYLLTNFQDKPKPLGWKAYYDDIGVNYDDDYYSAFSENSTTWDWNNHPGDGARAEGLVTFSDYLSIDSSELSIAGESRYLVEASLTFVNDTVQPFGLATKINSAGNDWAMIKYYPATEHLVVGVADSLTGHDETDWLTKTTYDYDWTKDAFHTLRITVDLDHYIAYQLGSTVIRNSSDDVNYADVSSANKVGLASDSSNSYIQFDYLKTAKWTRVSNLAIEELIKGRSPSVGWPSPSVSIMNPNETVLTGYFGSKFSIADLYDHPADGYALEFDTWASQANATYGPITFNVTLLTATDPNYDHTPLNLNDLRENFTRFNDIPSLVFSDLFEGQTFQNYCNYWFSDYLVDYVETVPFTEDFDVFVNIEAYFEADKQNQTVYFDNVYLTPTNYYLPGTVEDDGRYYSTDPTVCSSGEWSWTTHNGAQMAREPQEEHFSYWDPEGDSSAEISVEASDLTISGATKYFVETALIPQEFTSQYDSFGLRTALGSGYYAQIQYEDYNKLKMGISTSSSWVGGHTLEEDFVWAKDETHKILVIVDLDNDWAAFSIDGRILYNETDNTYLSSSTAGTTLLTVDNYYGCTTKEVVVETFRTGTFEELNFGATGTKENGEGYELRLNWNLQASSEQGELFVPEEDAKVNWYPFVTLDDLLTTDRFASGTDYEFAVKLFDQTFDRFIWLHYCWSNDSTLIGGHEDKEVTIRPDNTTHFYLWQEEELQAIGQTVTLDLMTGLNELVKQSLLVIDRENTTYTMDMYFQLENASNIQISGLHITGYKPSWTINLNPETTFEGETAFGEFLGRTKNALIAQCYLWSRKQQLVTIQTQAEAHWLRLSVNGRLTNTTKDPATVLESKTILTPGLNYIALALGNNPSGSSFHVKLLNASGVAIPAEVYQVPAPNISFDYPFIQAPIGTGTIGCFALNFDDQTQQESLKTLLANLLTNKLEQQNLDFRAKKQAIISAVDDSIYYKEADLYHDWMNEDQVYGNTNPQDLFMNVEGQLQIANKKLYEVLALARSKEGTAHTYEQMSDLEEALKDMFVEMKMTGNKDGWYPHSSLHMADGDGNDNTEADRYPYDLDKDHCFYIYENMHLNDPCPGQGWNHHHYGFVKGTAPIQDQESGRYYIQLTLKIWAYQRSWLGYVWQDDEQISGLTRGIVHVYNASHVYVQHSIINSEYTTYVPSGSWISLVDFFNATACVVDSMNDFVPAVDDEPSNPEVVEFLGTGMASWLSRALSSIPAIGLYGVATSKHLKNYIDNLRWKIFGIGQESALNYLQTKEEQYALANGYDTGTLSNEGYLSALNYETTRNHSLRLRQQSADPPTPDDLGFGDKFFIDKWFHGDNDKENAGSNIRKAPVWNDIVEQFVAFGTAGSEDTQGLTESIVSMLNEALSIYLNINVLNYDQWFALTKMAQQTNYGLVPVETGERTKDENGEWQVTTLPKMSLIVLGPQNEAIQSQEEASIPTIGFSVETWLKLLISQEEGIVPVFQRRFVFDYEQFDTALRKLFDENFYGTDKSHMLYGSLEELNNLDKLSTETITINGEQREVTYYQLTSYSRNGEAKGNPMDLIFGTYTDENNKKHFFPAYFINGNTRKFDEKFKEPGTEKLVINNYAKYITAAPAQDSVELTAIQSLENLDESHPFYEEAYETLLEKGWIPYQMPGTNDGGEKVILWLDTKAILFDVHPPAEIQEKKEEMSDRVRIVPGKTEMDPKTSGEDIASEDQHAVSTDGAVSVNQIAVEREEDGETIEKIETTIVDTPFANHWKRMIKNALINFRFDYRRYYSSKSKIKIYHNQDALWATALLFLTLPQLVADISGEQLEKIKTSGSREETIREKFGKIVEDLKKQIGALTYDVSGKEGTINSLSGILNIFSIRSKVLRKKHDEIWDTLWGWSGWEDLYDRDEIVIEEDGSRKSQDNFFVLLAHGDLVKSTQAALEERLAMMKTGDVPKIAGLLFTIMSLNNGIKQYKDANGELIHIMDFSDVDPYVLIRTAQHELGGFHGVHYGTDLITEENEEKYLPLIFLIKMFRAQHDALRTYGDVWNNNKMNRYDIYSSFENILPEIILKPDNPGDMVPTWIEQDNKQFFTYMPLDRATNSAMRHFFDSMFFNLMITENAQREDYQVINELVEQLRLYDVLETITSQSHYDRYKYSGSSKLVLDLIGLDIKDFFKRDKDFLDDSTVNNEVEYIANYFEEGPLSKQRLGYMSFVNQEINNLVKKAGLKNVASADVISFLGSRLLGQRLKVKNKDGKFEYVPYTFGDLARDTTVFVVEGKNNQYQYYKPVIFQECDEQGEPKYDDNNDPIWVMELVELTKSNLDGWTIRKLDDKNTLTKEITRTKDGQGKYKNRPKATLVSLKTKDGDRKLLANFVKFSLTKIEYQNTNDKNFEIQEVTKIDDPAKAKGLIAGLEKIVQEQDEFKQTTIASLAGEQTSKIRTIYENIKNRLMDRNTDSGDDEEPASHLRRNPWIKGGKIRNLDALEGTLTKEELQMVEHEISTYLSTHPLIDQAGHLQDSGIQGSLKAYINQKKKVFRKLLSVLAFASTITVALIEFFSGGSIGESASAIASISKVSTILKTMYSRNYQAFQAITGRSINGFSLGRVAGGWADGSVSGRMLFKMTSTQSLYSFGQSVNNLGKQLWGQIWMKPIIEGSVLTGYLETTVKNAEGIIGNGTVIGQRGTLVERYAMDYEHGDPGYYPGINEDHNRTRHTEALARALWIYVTDYVELCESFEVINGKQTGKMLARMDCGMLPLYNGTKTATMDDLESVLTLLKGWLQLTDRNVPNCMDNLTRLAANPAFKWAWQNIVLSFGGAVISFLTELAGQTITMGLTGSLSGVYSSMLCGWLANAIYESVYTSYARSNWQNNYVNLVCQRKYRQGDPGYDRTPFSSWYDLSMAIAPDLETFSKWATYTAAGFVLSTIILNSISYLICGSALFGPVGVGIMLGIVIIGTAVLLILREEGVLKKPIDETYGDP
ncbi:MAG: hypothetical protein GF308_07505 [Candidatus Heimdallarchaeota archaeon]|nr:hypothetical protein [Candidatus Heimdallarchaeota archaeon]